MKTAGFYRGIAHHEAHVAHGTIGQAPATDDPHTRRLVATYLAHGGQVTASPGSGSDVFGSGEPVSMDVLSDGEWVWPEDAAFYCERYGVLPDAALVTEALKANGHCPRVSHDRLKDLAQELHAPYAPRFASPFGGRDTTE